MYMDKESHRQNFGFCTCRKPKIFYTFHSVAWNSALSSARHVQEMACFYKQCMQEILVLIWNGIPPYPPPDMCRKCHVFISSACRKSQFWYSDIYTPRPVHKYTTLIVFTVHSLLSSFSKCVLWQCSSELNRIR